MSPGCHPVLKRMLNLGCSREKDAAVAFQVYLDLIEVQVLWNVQYHFCPDMDILYLTGKVNECQEDPDVVIPLSSAKEISPAWLMKVQQRLSHNGNLSVILALKDADSTIVYYKVSEGLVVPDSPDTMKVRRVVENNMKTLHSELWRKRNLLYETAQQNVLGGELLPNPAVSKSTI